MNISKELLIKKRNEKYKNVVGALSKKEYSRRILVHYETINKYMSQFSEYLLYYMAGNFIGYLKLRIILGKNFENIIDEKKPSINDIYKIFKWFNLKKDFLHYFLHKTHLSYDIYHNPIPYLKKNKKNILDRYKEKFAEFIFLILSEYIILHNYMAVGNLKTKDIKTIDKFMGIIK